MLLKPLTHSGFFYVSRFIRNESATGNGFVAVGGQGELYLCVSGRGGKKVEGGGVE